MKKPILLLLFSLCTFIVIANNDFTIENYHVDIRISEDGLMHIVETIDVNYHKKMRGIFREINKKGKFLNHTQYLKLSDFNVENYNYVIENTSKLYRIRIGDADKYITGKHSYTISYKATNGILNFEGHEEFYWNIISPKWKQKILNASFVIHLPKSIDLDKDDMQIFAGLDEESTSYGKILQEGKMIKGTALVQLGKGNGLSTSFRVPNGYFFETAFSSSNGRDEPKEKKQRNDQALAIPFLLIGLLIWNFIKHGRNNIEFVEEEIFYPPESMTPAEVGTFYDSTVNNRDVISLLPHWGVKGKIRMQAIQIGSESDIQLEKVADLDLDAADYEKFFFNSLFKTNDSILVSDLMYEFYKEYAQVKDKIKEEALDPPYYDQDAISKFHSWPMLLLSAISIATAIFLMIKFHAIFTGIALLVLGVIAFIIYFIPPKKSYRGIDLKHKLMSFKNTLENSDPKKLAEVVSNDQKYFEKVFPFAVAYGIDKNFVDKFSEIYTKAPDWYYYGNGHQSTWNDFQKDLSMETVGSTISVPPVADSSSSSFNRSSGGGSVGGGFGGGGGGGW